MDVSNVRAQQTKEINHKKNVSNTMSLVKVLFEDISLAINIWKKSKYEQLQVKDASDLHDTLFNTTKMSHKGYAFCKHEGNYDQLTSEEIDLLDLFESWCLFIHCLLHKNRLALLSGVHSDETSFVSDGIYWRQSGCDLIIFDMAKNKSHTNPLILGYIDISV